MAAHNDFDIGQMISTMQETMEHEAKFACIAPGRVNLIGEHTDYNDGFVLPIAIRWTTGVFAAPRPDNTVKVYSKTLDKHAEISLENLTKQSENPWVDYIIGIIWALRESGRPIHGADLFIDSMIPIGAGLSSSAALEMATLGVFEAIGDYKLEGMEAAKLGQRVENEFLGLKSGIMDQAIVRNAKEHHAMLLDCRSLEHTFHPFMFEDTVLVISHTGVDRALVKSPYNDRVYECQEALLYMKDYLGATAYALRDFDEGDLEACRPVLGQELYLRARHVIYEINRVHFAVDAIKDNDVVQFGKLMNQSHMSLKNDYWVTGKELDTMCEIARSLPGCYGSRMTGAGFGGCAIHLVEFPHWDSFQSTLKEQYEAATGLECTFCMTHAAAGPKTFGPFN